MEIVVLWFKLIYFHQCLTHSLTHSLTHYAVKGGLASDRGYICKAQIHLRK